MLRHADTEMSVVKKEILLYSQSLATGGKAPVWAGPHGKGQRADEQAERRISGLSPYCGLHRKKEMKLGEEI